MSVEGDPQPVGEGHAARDRFCELWPSTLLLTSARLTQPQSRLLSLFHYVSSFSSLSKLCFSSFFPF